MIVTEYLSIMLVFVPASNNLKDGERIYLDR